MMGRSTSPSSSRLQCISVAILLSISGLAEGQSYSAQANLSDSYLSALVSARVTSGSLLVSKAGQIVHTGGYGWSSEELGVPLMDTTIFPIGSNTKLYTAVAIYQLQERGLLNVSDPVNGYIDLRDFGLNGTWCPLVHGYESLGCQKPTFRQLLEMSSGLLPSDNMACGVPGVNSAWNATDWYYKYRAVALNVSWGELEIDGPPDYTLQAGWPLAQTLRWQGTLLQPMAHAPGEAYCYVNANFNLAGYVVEKLTNMTLSAYFQRYIIAPAGLNSTYYWVGGQGLEPTGIRKGVVSLPAYSATFTASPGQGAPAFKVMNRVPYNPTDLSLFAGAAGAMFSDTRDQLRFYMTLLTNPAQIGLSPGAVEEIRRPQQLVTSRGADRYYFSQGLVVVEPSNSTSRQMVYIGSIWDYYAQIHVWVNEKDPAKSDAVVFFSNASPIIPAGRNGCAVTSAAANGGVLQLSKDICGDGTGLQDVSTAVVDRMAEIWNITGAYYSPV